MSMYNELEKTSQPHLLKNSLVVTALMVFGIVVLGFGLLTIQSTTSLSPLEAINDFLGLDSLHLWWYISGPRV